MTVARIVANSRRVTLALWSLIVASALVLIVARIRTGPHGWVTGLLRIGLLATLTLFVQAGKSWARWVLVALLALSTLGFLVSFLTVAGYPIAIVLFVMMIALHVWAIVELVNIELAQPAIKNV